MVVVYGYHLIFSAYGFWLPNDPRGSRSTAVRTIDLYLAGGPATKTIERRSVAMAPHDRAKRLAVKELLARPPVTFDATQRAAVGAGIGFYARKSGLPVWACAVMPDHVHVAFGRSRLTAEQVAVQFKTAATRHLVDVGLHPFPPEHDGETPAKCWAKGEWKVFLAADDVPRVVEYIEGNPVRAGLPPQAWDFVSPPPMTPSFSGEAAAEPDSARLPPRR